MRVGFLAVLALLALGLTFAVISTTARADGELDAGGTPGVQLVASIDAPGDILRSGGSLPIRVRVVDQHGAPVVGAGVRASADGVTVTPAAVETDGNGLAHFTVAGTVAEAQEIVVTFDIAAPEAIPDHVSMTIIAVPPPPRPVITREETAVSAGIGAAILAAIAATEFGRYGLSNLVVFPLYSRLKREEVLDHFVRGQIYGYIMSHPGEHYNSLKDALKVTNGTLAHHLRTLEMQGFIKADRDGIYKRFYPVEMQIPRDKGIRLSDLQHNLLGLIRTDGGPTQQDLAGRLGVSQQTVSYNLRYLSREGLVRVEKDGRATRYYAADT